jgi:hypothetical protein
LTVAADTTISLTAGTAHATNITQGITAHTTSTASAAVEAGADITRAATLPDDKKHGGKHQRGEHRANPEDHDAHFAVPTA